MSAPSVSLHVAGTVQQLEHFVLSNWRFNALTFPATFAVIRHPKRGVVLFDTGYSQRFMSICQRWPEKLYTTILPTELRPEAEPVRQLAEMGIAPSDVRWVFISHFHIDHVAALCDFPKAHFFCHTEGWDVVKSLGRWSGLRKAFLPDLLPEDFVHRCRPFVPAAVCPPELAPFTRGLDLFGDGTLWAIELPGHTEGHCGLLVRSNNAGDVFLVGDAVYSGRALDEEVLPHTLTQRLLFSDRRRYGDTLRGLAQVKRRGDITVIPAHCMDAVAQFQGRSTV